MWIERLKMYLFGYTMKDIYLLKNSLKSVLSQMTLLNCFLQSIRKKASGIPVKFAIMIGPIIISGVVFAVPKRITMIKIVTILRIKPVPYLQ
jgi:hypothetical protein